MSKKPLSTALGGAAVQGDPYSTLQQKMSFAEQGRSVTSQQGSKRHKPKMRWL